MNTELRELNASELDLVSGGTKAQVFFNMNILGVKMVGGINKDGVGYTIVSDGKTTYYNEVP